VFISSLERGGGGAAPPGLESLPPDAWAFKLLRPAKNTKYRRPGLLPKEKRQKQKQKKTRYILARLQKTIEGKLPGEHELRHGFRLTVESLPLGPLSVNADIADSDTVTVTKDIMENYFVAVVLESVRFLHTKYIVRKTNYFSKYRSTSSMREGLS
jgi:hypothetical protein